MQVLLVVVLLWINSTYIGALAFIILFYSILPNNLLETKFGTVILNVLLILCKLIP